MTRWDAQWYSRIATEGYAYSSHERSDVAFFPLYPVAGAILATLGGLRIDMSLLVVAHVFLLGSFFLFHVYLLARVRSFQEGKLDEVLQESSGSPAYALIAFAFWPTTFFFRMAYTESLFFFLCLLTVHAFVRNWRSPIIAVIVGLATATRPVGIALLIPFALHVYRQVLPFRTGIRRSLVFVLLCLVACWGLLAYMLYQYVTFGDALAFAKTQAHWRIRGGSLHDKAVALATLEPLWSVYLSGSDAYFARRPHSVGGLFNLQAANPIYFVVAVSLVVLGVRRKWLNEYEVLLSVGLITIPYVTRSYEMAMSSQGRFMAVVFPMYIVMGELLRRIPAPWQSLIIAPAAVLMAIYAALFAAGYVVI
jgi:hypothetical protein